MCVTVPGGITVPMRFSCGGSVAVAVAGAPVDVFDQLVTSNVGPESRRDELARERRTLALRSVIRIQLHVPEVVQRREPGSDAPVCLRI